VRPLDTPELAGTIERRSPDADDLARAGFAEGAGPGTVVELRVPADPDAR